MKIVRYKREYEAAVIAAIKEDPDWDIFTSEEATDGYKKRLCESITYVCFDGDMFSGYLRAILDDGLSLYISELFVVLEMRNRKIGRRLIFRLRSDFRDLTLYALSDEDAYYEKLGHKKVGSVFEIDE